MAKITLTLNEQDASFLETMLRTLGSDPLLTATRELNDEMGADLKGLKQFCNMIAKRLDKSLQEMW